MVHAIILLHLVLMIFQPQVVVTDSFQYGVGGPGEDNGHSAKKSPMDYSRYAEDVRDLVNHDTDRNSLAPAVVPDTCEDRYELKNRTIIRTKDSMKSGAEFIDDMKVFAATDCRWHCCNDESSCDTAIFIEDSKKDKNCFMFKCWFGDSLRCHFASHSGYVSAVDGGFVEGVQSSHGTVDQVGMPMTSNSMSDKVANDKAKTAVEEEAKDEVHDTQYEEETPPQDEQTINGAPPSSNTNTCRPDQIQCANGECIIAHYVCNDITDCSDGSDEIGCKYDTHTSPSESSLTTNRPKMTGPVVTENPDRLLSTEDTRGIDLEDVRNELANELHGQSKQVRKQNDDDANDDEESTNDDDNDELENEAATPAKSNPENDPQSGRNEPKEPITTDDKQDKSMDSQLNEKLPDGVDDYAKTAGDEPEEDDDDDRHVLSQPDPEQEELTDVGDDPDGDDDPQWVKTRYRDDNPPKIPSTDLHESHEREDETRYETGEDYLDGGDLVGLYDKSQRPERKHPSGDDRDQQPYYRQPPNHAPYHRPAGKLNYPNRIDDDYYRDAGEVEDDRNTDLYPYDDYNFPDNVPYVNPPDYNYHTDRTYGGRFADRNPMYPDDKNGDDPNYINYHRRDRINGKQYNYDEDRTDGEQRMPERPHGRTSGRVDWRGQDNDPDEEDDNTEEGSRRRDRPNKNYPAGSRHQNGPGSWRQWNDFNHPDGGYRTGQHDGGHITDDVVDGKDESKEVADGTEEDKVKDAKDVANDVAADTDVVTPIDNAEPNEPPSTPPNTEDKATEQDNTPTPETETEKVIKHGDQPIHTTPPVSNPVQVGPDTISKVGVPPISIRPATSAILPLAIGLIITLFLLMMLSCRLRYMNQRLRYGRLKTHAHDADYLINGMYL